MRYERQKSHFVADYLDVLNIDYFSAKWRKVCKMLLKRWCDTALFDDIFGGNAQKRGKIRWGGAPRKGQKNPRTKRDAVCFILLHESANKSIFVSTGPLAPLAEVAQRGHCDFRVPGW